MSPDVEGPEPQSFIIKVWIEESSEQAGHVVWRGHVTHVPSGLRRYVQSWQDIFAFLTQHLGPLGITLERINDCASQ